MRRRRFIGSIAALASACLVWMNVRRVDGQTTSHAAYPDALVTSSRTVLWVQNDRMPALTPGDRVTVDHLDEQFVGHVEAVDRFESQTRVIIDACRVCTFWLGGLGEIPELKF